MSRSKLREIIDQGPMTTTINSIRRQSHSKYLENARRPTKRLERYLFQKKTCRFWMSCA